MKFILSSIVLASAFSVQAAPFESCLGFFKNGKPPELTSLALGKQRDLCFDSFAVMYSGESKTPIFVAQRLNRALIADAKGEDRKNRFYEEARLPLADRATLADYVNTGYHRGHMAPAGDMPNPNAMAQSFSLANTVPQVPRSNSGPWKKVEISTRRYAARAHGDVYVITGPIYTKFADSVAAKAIGKNGVWVPIATFKLIHDAFTGKSWAFIVENSDTAVVSKPIELDELTRQLHPTFKNLLPQ